MTPLDFCCITLDFIVATLCIMWFVHIAKCEVIEEIRKRGGGK